MPSCLLSVIALLCTAPWAAAQSTPPRNPFFVLDNGLGRGVWTPQQQAQAAKELGLDGVSYNYTKPEAIATWRAELGKHSVKLAALYFYTSPDKVGDQRFPPGLRSAIKELKGSQTVLWMTILMPKDKKKTGYDEACVKIVNEIADMGKETDLRVSIYPHAGFYVADAQEALRIVKLVNRADVGMTVNLCHELMGKNAARLLETVKEAAPHLTMVTINGADAGGKITDSILRLDQGNYDVYAFLKTLRDQKYAGPIGLQCYNIKGDQRENLEKSMAAWKKYLHRLESEEKK